MDETGMLARARVIAAAAHGGQRDKAGDAYMAHVERVAASVLSEEERVVALLHDVVERSGWTLEALAAEGFPPRIVAAVAAMTRRPGESDDALVRRAAADDLALPVRKADLEDNLRQAWRAGLPPERYEAGLNILRDALGGEW